jgi:3-hydroxybutyryl-CoA dehydrogenase
LRQKIIDNLNNLEEKGRVIRFKRSQTIQNLHFTTEITDCRASIFIEAISENIDVKSALFKNWIELTNLVPSSLQIHLPFQ